MGFLDKLKPQPRWKHADAAVRLDALRELEDPIELAVLAETDSDARVRRAALGRIDDAATLGRIAAGDTDAEARDRAADRLLAVAGGSSPDALAAARAIVDAKRLSTLAKSDASDAVRAEALARLTDARALGAVARHARHEATATAALARVSDAETLLDIALNAEHKDVAVAAFDRVASSAPDLAQLRSIETRAQQKAVSKRARTMIQDIETAEAARRAAEEDRRRREASLCDAVEKIAGIADAVSAREELTRVTDAWRALEQAAPASADRFAQGVRDAESAIAKREREVEEAAELARARAEAIATRDTLCLQVEALDGDDILEQLAPLEEEWRSLLPLVGNGPEADRLAERFALAVAACRKRHEMGAKLAETRASLDALVVDAETLPSQEDRTAAAARWQTLSREARGLTAILSDARRPADDLVARFDAVAAAFAARDAEAMQAVEKAKQDLAALLQRLIDRAKRASDAEAITLREGERLMRDIGAGLDAAQGVDNKDVSDAAGRLRTLQEAIAPRVKDLREMDDWRRFANAQRQEQLIAMAEAIVASLKADDEEKKESDLAATAKALRELHAKWQEVAEAPRNVAQRLWDRFRTATDLIRSRCEIYFVKMREERAAALEHKNAIVTEAEALANSQDWGKAAARFQELQVAWQALGPVARESGRELSQRFRTASNTFFARRREDLTERKKVWTDNLAKKESFCERAEALAESTDWDNAAAEMKKLQADWKTVGPVRRNKSDVIWARFRAAADKFFERYHHRHEIALQEKLAEREAMVVELEGLIAPGQVDGTETVSDLAERVQAVRNNFNRAVPIPGAGMKALIDRWQAALSRIVEQRPDAFKGTDLDPALVIQRMEKLVARVESLLDEVREPAHKQALSQTELLAAKLRNALASNAMGGRTGEDAKWRAAGEAVKDAQAAWQRLAPSSAPEAQTLDARFRDASRRVMDKVRQHGGGHSEHRAGGSEPQRGGGDRYRNDRDRGDRGHDRERPRGDRQHDRNARREQTASV